MKFTLMLSFLVATLSMGAASGAVRVGALDETRNIAEVASTLSFLSTLVTLVSLGEESVAPVLERVTGDEPTTIFAPTDDAFAALGPVTTEFLLDNPDVLAKVLLYHAVDGVIPSQSITTAFASVPTLLGENIIAKRVVTGFCFFDIFCDAEIFINNSRVVVPDVPASNGIVHVIDTVLRPPGVPLFDLVDTATENGLDTLVTAVLAAGLEDTLRGEGPFTVFAPSSDAFAALPPGLISSLLQPEGIPLLTDILLYHVVVGDSVAAEDIIDESIVETAFGQNVTLLSNADGIFVEDATDILAAVIVPDVFAINGVAHVIDKVLVFEGLEVRSGIVDIALEAEDLTTLVGALSGANLVPPLLGDGPFTVLAPVNSAFEALGDLSTVSNEELENILLYHVLPGRLTSDVLLTRYSAFALNRQSVSVSAMDGQIFINDSRVIEADILASNGVIHKIDRVLSPRPVFVCPYPEWVCAFLNFYLIA